MCGWPRAGAFRTITWGGCGAVEALYTREVLEANPFQYMFMFLNYESMMTHLQETWKIQNKVTYSSTIYYNYF